MNIPILLVKKQLLDDLTQGTWLLRQLKNKNLGPLKSNSVFINHLCIVLIFILGGRKRQTLLLNIMKKGKKGSSQTGHGEVNGQRKGRLGHEGTGCYTIEVAE